MSLKRDSDNKMLAEFMDYKSKTATYSGHLKYLINDHWYPVGTLQFHSSWASLMPILEKICGRYNGGINVIFDEKVNYVVQIGSGPKFPGVSIIEAAYNAVVDFVKKQL